MSQSRDLHSHAIEHKGWTYHIQRDKLRVLREGEEHITLPLTPRVGSRRCALGPWRKAGRYHLRAIIKGVGAAHVGVRHGHVAFWIETKVKQFETLTYFAGMTFNGERWQSYVSDEWDRLWEKDRDQEVGISSAYRDMINVFQSEPGGQPDPRDYPPTYVWNMPPRAFSVQTPAGFVGFSIPGPLPVGVTRLTMRDRRLSLSFDALRPACTKGVGPIVYVIPGLPGAHDVLDEHRVISDKLGLTKKKSAKHPAWWGKPVYKASVEYIRHWQEIDRRRKWTEARHGSGPLDATIQQERMQVITPENLRGWALEVKASLRQDEMNVMFEQGIFGIYGDYTPVPTLGGTEGFRKLVDEFRGKGIHVCYYIHPFMVSKKLPYFQKHPEALCQPIDKKTEMFYNTEHLYDPSPKLGLLDWTHPRGRNFLLAQVEYILSNKKGCLDCDWLRSNHWRAPDPRYFKFHDPDWGIGDMMSMKAQKLLYEKAKSVKPHCCVSKTAFAEPYMQPYADVDMLCEDHVPATDHWYERSDIATRLQRDMIFLTDPWHVSITKSAEYYMAMAAWNVVEVPDVNHAIHPYTCFLPLRPQDYNRRRAGVQTQANAPLNATDLVHVGRLNGKWESPAIWRKRTQGPLKGWYAALALSKRAFVTYSESEARIAASETRAVRIPLPPGAKVTSVEMIPHEGKKRTWPGKLVTDETGDMMEMKVEDCGGAAMYYRVAYRLPAHARRGR